MVTYMEKQICSKCKTEKNIDEFYFRKNQNKYNTICKKCCNERAMNRYNRKKDEISKERKLYYQQNKQKLLNYSIKKYYDNKEEKKQKSREYYYKNKEKRKEYSKKYFKENFDNLKNKKREYYNCNKQYVIERQLKYYQEHKEERLQYYKQYRSKKENKEKINNYIKKRKETNNLYRYSTRIRRLIKISISKMGYTKKSKTYQILGCDFETAYNHLLKTYKDNYGVDYDFKEKVHIDHIIPISQAKNEIEVNKLNYYKNLQLLKEKDNLEKSDKLDWTLRRK